MDSTVPLFSEILLEVSGAVATITLNRPQRGNAITPTMGKEIETALEFCKEQPHIRLLILTATGRYFCTGMDLTAGNQSDLQEDLQQGAGTAARSSLQLFLALQTFPKPVVLRMNGPAYGGGCGLVFCTDFRIAHEECFLCFSEVQRGIVPALISSIIVPQLGLFTTKQFMMSAEKLSVSRLFALGQMSRVVAKPEELDDALNHLVHQLLTCAPSAVAETKATCRFVAENSRDASVQFVQQVFSRTVQSPEAIFGVSEFLQKRTPNWENFRLFSADALL